MKIIEPEVIHDIYDGVIEGKNVQTYKKPFNEVKNLYKDISNIKEDAKMYTVYSYEKGNPKQKGNLMWGLTILEPVYINDECNMTRGHFHEDKDCVEFYFGIQGEGLLVLMDEHGETWAEKVYKGSLHYIDGKIAHRLVNVGDEPLKVGACWPNTAGHDYASIEKKEFSYRIFRKNKKLVFEKR